jgi:hypothetical protein
MKDIRKIAKKLNSLKSDIEKIKFIAEHSDKLLLVLDNDETYTQWTDIAIPDGAEYEDMPCVAGLCEDIGNRQGVFNLLSIIGITAELC